MEASPFSQWFSVLTALRVLTHACTLGLPSTSQIWASAWGPSPLLRDLVFVLLIPRALLSLLALSCILAAL